MNIDIINSSNEDAQLSHYRFCHHVSHLSDSLYNHKHVQQEITKNIIPIQLMLGIWEMGPAKCSQPSGSFDCHQSIIRQQQDWKI